jgi:hypothetical protein
VYRPSLRSRVLEWVLWRIRAKSLFVKMEGFRETTIKSRRYNVIENNQHGQHEFDFLAEVEAVLFPRHPRRAVSRRLPRPSTFHPRRQNSSQRRPHYRSPERSA